MGRSLFVTRRAVDLAGQIKAFHPLGLEGGTQLYRIDEVVLDGVCRAHDVRLLQAADSSDQLGLDLYGQAVAQTRRVDLLGVQSFGLEDDLVAVPLRKADDLVFKRGAITGRHPFNDAAVQGGQVQVFPHHLVDLLAGVPDETGNLGQPRRLAREGEGAGGLLQRLLVKLGKIDAGPVQPRWGTGLHAAQAKAKRLEMVGQAVGGKLTGSAGLHRFEADVHQP